MVSYFCPPFPLPLPPTPLSLFHAQSLPHSLSRSLYLSLSMPPPPKLQSFVQSFVLSAPLAGGRWKERRGRRQAMPRAARQQHPVRLRTLSRTDTRVITRHESLLAAGRGTAVGRPDASIGAGGNMVAKPAYTATGAAPYHYWFWLLVVPFCFSPPPAHACGSGAGGAGTAESWQAGQRRAGRRDSGEEASWNDMTLRLLLYNKAEQKAHALKHVSQELRANMHFIMDQVPAFPYPAHKRSTHA